MTDLSTPPSIVDLWRMWTWLEEELLALPVTAGPGCKLQAEMTEQEYAAADRRHDDLCFEIDGLRTLVARAEIRTFEDIAVALDMILEYEAQANAMHDDRVLLHRLIDALRRLAPSVPIGAIDRMEQQTS